MRYLPLPRTAIPAVALATLVLMIWVGWGTVQSPAAFWAPGDLSRYHVETAGCTNCHAPFGGPSATRCVRCHSEGYFESRATPAVSIWHRDLAVRQTACTGCHTEHRGALAHITEETRMNPHGDLVFRATGAGSCTACHAFGTRVATKVTLKDELIVRRLYEKGRGAHQPGRMGDCLSCHGGGGP
ncbi:MAG TPA: CxxxxCH/CxxCH domain-containing protein [Nitrospira sp.]|nr:CxxxxCH/CxxCH domain-containing protein [Nitrospira sp.]HUM38257.1 CxxxxCH/CxxCH domain-containing protein [Nitrospira sp.]